MLREIEGKEKLSFGTGAMSGLRCSSGGSKLNMKIILLGNHFSRGCLLNLCGLLMSRYRLEFLDRLQPAI